MSRSFIVVGKWSDRERKKRRREKEIAAQIHDSAYEDAHASALSVQVGVRLDPEVADRLRKTGRGLSDEIRERLDRTFKYDQIDPITRELVEGIINIAALLRLDFETEWHAWPPPFEAFTEAIKQRAAEYAPPLDIPGDPGAAMEMLREGHQKRLVGCENVTIDGRMLINIWQKLRSASLSALACTVRRVRTND
jgi:hypothetical protein